MAPKIIKIQYKENYIYHIRFEDNREDDIDFASFLWGEAFQDLKDKTYFKKAYIDKTTGTIAWPNGVDLAPEAVYEKMHANASASLSRKTLNKNL